VGEETFHVFEEEQSRAVGELVDHASGEVLEFIVWGFVWRDHGGTLGGD
jgi:hypothetical protein